MRFLAIVAATTTIAPLSQALRPPPRLDKEILDALPFEADWGTNPRMIEFPCPECRVGPSGSSFTGLPLDYEPRPGENFLESVLRVNISVTENGNIDNLMLNDCSFYPAPTRCSANIRGDQFIKSPCGMWEYAATPPLAYTLSMVHIDDNVAGWDIKLMILKLWIRRVASILIKGQHPDRGEQPGIEVKMLVYPNGQLLIATDPARVPTNGSSPPDCSHHNPPEHRPPHRHHHHHHHHRHHWCFRYMKLLRAFVLHTLVPVVIGLVVAAAAFYSWRRRFLQRQGSDYSLLPQEVPSHDHKLIFKSNGS